MTSGLKPLLPPNNSSLDPACLAGQTAKEGKVVFNPMDPSQATTIHQLLGKICTVQRHAAISKQEGCNALAHGLDLTAPLQLEKSTPRNKQGALRMVWQGAFRCRASGPDTQCPLCQVPLTTEHVIYDCRWWHDKAAPPPPHWKCKRKQMPYHCLWMRGLVPASVTRLDGFVHGPDSEKAWGVAIGDTWPSDHVYATDDRRTVRHGSQRPHCCMGGYYPCLDPRRA